MQILLGKYKGKKLLVDKVKTRPTTGKVKEALSSILKNYLENARVLDLFCGSGAVGFEFLSCGAGELTGIDKDIRMAIKNAQSLNAINSRFYKNDSLSGITKLADKQEKFDIVFIDPPYNYKQKEDLLMAISNFDILTNEGIVIFETDKDTSFSEILGNLRIVKEYKYGYSKLTLFRGNWE
jgi:16S rRNA (guanine(966)-N(2))-methyltransferase RsmD